MSVMLGVVTVDAGSKFHESLNLELLLQVCEICSCSFVLATKQIIEINWNLFVSFKLPIMSGILNRVGTVRSTTGYGVWYCRLSASIKIAACLG
jgi:hypothetical protein